MLVSRQGQKVAREGGVVQQDEEERQPGVAVVPMPSSAVAAVAPRGAQSLLNRFA